MFVLIASVAIAGIVLGNSLHSAVNRCNVKNFISMHCTLRSCRAWSKPVFFWKRSL